MHDEREHRRTPAAVDRELDREPIRPIEAVQGRCRLVAHPAALAETQQPGAKASPMSVGCTSDGVDPGRDPPEQPIGDRAVAGAMWSRRRCGAGRSSAGRPGRRRGRSVRCRASRRPWVITPRRRKIQRLRELSDDPGHPKSPANGVWGGGQRWRRAGGMPMMSVIRSPGFGLAVLGDEDPRHRLAAVQHRIVTTKSSVLTAGMPSAISSSTIIWACQSGTHAASTVRSGSGGFGEMLAEHPVPGGTERGHQHFLAAGGRRARASCGWRFRSVNSL